MLEVKIWEFVFLIGSGSMLIKVLNKGVTDRLDLMVSETMPEDLGWPAFIVNLASVNR